MQVEILLGLPGSGKSREFLQEVIKTPGFYLVFSPIIDLIEEQIKALRLADPAIIVMEAHSEVRGRRQRVQARLDEARKSVEGTSHRRAVIFATHESLMTCDLSEFGNWHVRIDEAPNAVQSGQINMGQSSAYFAANFDLERAGEWSLLRPKIGLGNWKETAQDTLLGSQANFIKAAQRPSGVFVNIVDWQDAKSFEWCSVWSPTFLRHTRSVKIAGASYLESLSFRAVKKWWAEEVLFQPREIVRHRTGFPSISIHYFTQAHDATTKLWEESIGRKFIKAICDYLTEQEPSLGFWSGNKVVRWLMEHRVNGEPLKPKQAGMNEFAAAESCAFIYSSKPLDGDAPLRSLFEITDEQILAARENEDVFQFVFRGAIRRPEYDGAYRIYLHTRRQAEALKARIEVTGIARSVELVPVDAADIMDAKVGRSARKSGNRPHPVAERIARPNGRTVLAKSEKRKQQRAKARAAVHSPS
jgi:hypothetical protein